MFYVNILEINLVQITNPHLLAWLSVLEYIHIVHFSETFHDLNPLQGQDIDSWVPLQKRNEYIYIYIYIRTIPTNTYLF